MSLPGFAAEASLRPASQIYRLTSAHGRHPYSLAPAQVDLFILEPFPSGEGSPGSGSVGEGPHEDLCLELKMCCSQGVQECCVKYSQNC